MFVQLFWSIVPFANAPRQKTAVTCTHARASLRCFPIYFPVARWSASAYSAPAGSYDADSAAPSRDYHSCRFTSTPHWSGCSAHAERWSRAVQRTTCAWFAPGYHTVLRFTSASRSALVDYTPERGWKIFYRYAAGVTVERCALGSWSLIMIHTFCAFCRSHLYGHARLCTAVPYLQLRKTLAYSTPNRFVRRQKKKKRVYTLYHLPWHCCRTFRHV